MESLIVEFHRDLYIPAILKFSFHLPHVRIHETQHCGNTYQEAFKSHSYFQDMLCRREYVECLVARCVHQIQSEYYVGNRCVSIEGIALEHFSITDQETGSSPSHSFTRHAVFH